MPYIIFAFGALAALLFLIGSSGRRGQMYPRLARIAFRMIGLAGFAWSLLGIALVYAEGRFRPHTMYFLHILEAILAGIGIGILLLMIISGEIFGSRRAGGKKSREN